MPFLAVGGAEKIALKVMQNLAGQVRFVVLTFDALNAALGSMVDAFRQVTPYVYTLPDFTQSQLNASVLDYLIARFTPRTIYIANGSPWIYDALGEIKCRYPSIRLVNQVYDHQVGWINRYDAALVLYLDVHIGSNSRICQAYRQKGVREEQIYFIENGTDSQELDPARYDDRRVLNLKTRFGLPAQARVVTFASRLHPQKRPLDFIELARRFKNDPGVAFLMAGDGPLAAQVGEQIDKSGLTNLSRIPFYQPISDLLAVTDVLVLPSEFEGMPMIVLEAQTMGKPVVVTNVGNNRETLERTQGGVVLDQMGDISTMMRAVRHMLDQPPEPELLRRRTLAFFDWKAVAQKYLEALLG
jgi:glycosyltransferase involved in cell wall biosynthesis